VKYYLSSSKILNPFQIHDQVQSSVRKRILITGAAGFLGSHLCDRFIEEGYHVIAMDNLITGSLNNIEHLLKFENFEFHHHDVTTFVHVPGELDYILHFASPASPIDYLRMPIQTLKVGSLGTHNLLGLAKDKKARILVASTSEVYGDPLVSPQSEDYWGNVNPVGPRGVYDEATFSRSHDHGLPPCTRIGYPYCTYLQYVWSPYAEGRWTGIADFCGAGTAGRGYHYLWRWDADPFVLLYL